MTINPTLEIKDLSMVYATKGVDLPVLRDINLQIQPGQIYGLVGESGSGKTTLGLAIMRYLPPEGRVTTGSIRLNSVDLLSKPSGELRKLWGSDFSFVPQDPSSSLNPSLRVGDQLAENFRSRREKNNRAVNLQIIEWMEQVRLPNPTQIAKKYPHELSGGQKQRILLAMALSNQPKLLILDEPTTSLDVTTEAVVLDLLRELIASQNISAMFITHNLGVVAGLTDRVGVLYAGELVEETTTDNLFQQPFHPYTQGLLKSVPTLGIDNQKLLLSGIPGQIPSLDALPSGCVFAPRCKLVIDQCRIHHPPLEQATQDHRVRCHRWREIQTGEISIEPSLENQPFIPDHQTEPLLEVSDLDVVYPVRRSGIASLLGKKKLLKAVDHVSLKIRPARTLGIVGESGSGKSSLALAIMGLADAPEGEISLMKVSMPLEIHQRNQDTLRKLQMVFQHHDEAFSPHLRIEQILSRPLINLLGYSKQAARDRISELLAMVSLPAGYAQRFPRQLSGGEKQRVAIAQAFAANPSLLLADEPVSALDVSVQANILNLLKGIKRDQQTAIILISHDIGAVSYLADDVAVMYLGQVMEYSPENQLLKPPFHPYTEALLSAIPVADPAHKAEVIHLEGEIPNPLDRPIGCPFHTRCPRSLGRLCQQQTPPWQSVLEGGKVYCHIPVEELRSVQKGLFPKTAKRGVD